MTCTWIGHATDATRVHPLGRSRSTTTSDKLFSHVKQREPPHRGNKSTLPLSAKQNGEHGADQCTKRYE